jgi:hypothetical protein
VRQHVVAREQDTGLLVDEHDVSLRVTGGRQGDERAVAEVDLRGAVEPLVRQLVVRGPLAVLLAPERVPPPADQRLGAPADHQRGLVVDLALVGSPQHPVERGLLTDAQRDLRAERAAQADRERVVVAVHVGDEEARDVLEPAVQPAQGRLELLTGHVERPAGVDQHQPVGGLDGVDVHRPQPVGRQRQRYPVHAGGHLVHTWLEPRVPVRVRHRPPPR